jgi:hypothetical protein
MTRLVNFARHNAIALAALFIALGGTSYAALRPAAGSVGTRQLRNHSVSASKLARHSIAGYVRDWAKISGVGTVIASRPRAHTVNWNFRAPQPGGTVSWGRRLPNSCFALATVQYGAALTSQVSATVFPTGNHPGVFVLLSAPAPVNVAVICPQP